VAGASYTLKTATPTFNPPGGTYVLNLTVSISDVTPGATIYYTTDGSTPTTSSPVYGSPIVLAPLTTTTIKAIAVAPGQSGSTVASVTYTVVL
jgi:chitinase